MAFTPIGPVVNKIIEKSVEFVPLIGPGLKYVKKGKKVKSYQIYKSCQGNHVHSWHLLYNLSNYSSF